MGLVNAHVHKNTGRGFAGRFTSQYMDPRVKEAHALAAKWIADRALQLLKDGVAASTWTPRSQQVLVHAVADEGFYPSSIHSFTINPDGYLDSSGAARYWRGIESGTDSHLGQHVFFPGKPISTGYADGSYSGDLRTTKNGSGGEITNAIVGYEFIQRAVAEFVAEGGITPFYAKAGVIQ